MCQIGSVFAAAVVWARHATLPPLGEGALRDEPKQRLRRRLEFASSSAFRTLVDFSSANNTNLHLSARLRGIQASLQHDRALLSGRGNLENVFSGLVVGYFAED